MPEDPRDWRPSEHREELHDPANPPNALLAPETRNRALMSYVAPIVVLFVIVGVALIYWANRDLASTTAGTDETENAIGTAGSDSPGGFDPTPTFEGTDEELRFRGVGPGAAGIADSPGAAAETMMDLDAVAHTTAGRRVRLQNIEVERVEQNVLWVGSGNTRVAVLSPAGTTVSAGDRIDVTGTTEIDDRSAVRIRASEVTAR